MAALLESAWLRVVAEASVMMALLDVVDSILEL
jgi:hypothetical protein